MKSTSNIRAGIVLLIIALGFMLLFYRAAVFNPNHFLFSNSGDGIKNYYTYYYHIVHDTSFVHFAGMNYPYGEHFLYTDCHPVLTGFFKLLNGSGFFNRHAIGILNLLMMLSVFATFLLVYLVLLAFNIRAWIAVLFGAGIAILAPQIFRLGGHFALSYSMAIPLSWFLMIRFVNAPKKGWWTFGLTLNNLFWLFIHSYLGIILLSFEFAFFTLHLFWHRANPKAAIHYLNLFLTVALPVLVFYLFLLATDTHEGRTTNPSGFYLYNAEPDDVFVPHHPPLRPLLNRIPGLIINLKWEAWSYVGLTTTVALIGVLVLAVISLFKKKKRKRLSLYFSNPQLNISLLAAFVVLLFAMAFPFKTFPQLLEVFPVFKQFRATGRFAWVFYFVSTVFGARVFQLVSDSCTQKGKRLTGYVMVVAAALFMVFEGLPYHTEMSKAITSSPNQFSDKYLKPNYRDAISSIRPGKFQAILPLPFYYQGSESYARPRQDDIMRASMLVSAHTGLPMFSANLTRTAIPESKKIVQLVSPSFYEKPIQHDLPNHKPVLIATTGQALTIYEEMILKRAKLFFSAEGIKLYSLAFDDLFGSTADSFVNKFKARKDRLFAKNGFLVSDSSAFLYFNGFEQQPAEIAFRGTGSFTGSKSGKNILAEFAPGTFGTGKKYNLSCWMYNGFKDALNLHFQLRVEAFDEANGVWESTVYFPDQSEVINGNWSLAEMGFTVSNTNHWIYIVTKGKADARPPFVADDLLIRERGSDVYRIDTLHRRLFYNNHQIKF